MEGIINIAGTMPRIGTTTVAMQLIRFIYKFGYTAAYIEMNDHRYAESAYDMYADTKKDDDLKMITCEGIDCYPPSGLKTLTSGGAPYDFLVCDYGSMTEDIFKKTEHSFKNNGIPIIVAGVKANEIKYTENALRDRELDKAIYIFNFMKDDDKAEISGKMLDRSSLTTFMNYVPDPFDKISGETADICLGVMNNVMKLLRKG